MNPNSSGQNQTCRICNNVKEKPETLKLTCNHEFCWKCLETYLNENNEISPKCPEPTCDKNMEDTEKRKVLNEEDVDKYDNQCLKNMPNFHECLLCKTVVVCPDPDTQYECDVCSLYNCLACGAAHTEYRCKGFKSLSSQDQMSYHKAEMDKAKEIYEERKRMKMREDCLSADDVEIVQADCIFECGICCRCLGKEDGVVLKNCCCLLCKWCLSAHILSSMTIPVVCPECEDEIYEAEIYNILSPEEFPKYIKMINDIAKSQLDSCFQCQATDCGVLHHTKATTTSFTCVKCKALNCIKCKTVHINETCEQYKVRLSNDKNQQFIEEQIRQGLIWPCIVCQTHLRKVSGCNWIQCPSCKTELCWINRIKRWGPKGRDDISGGCRCGVNGIRCHVDCETSCTPHDSTNNNNQTNSQNMESVRSSYQRIVQNMESVRPSNQRNSQNMESVRPSNQRIAQNMESVRPSNQTNSQNEESWCNIL